MAEAKTTKLHFYSIDILRGVAALSVCFFHFSEGFLQPDNWLRVLNQYGYLGVDAFFVISGFVVPYSFAQKNYTVGQFGSFLKKRFVRIEPAFWVSIVLVMFSEVRAFYLTDYRYFKLPPWTFENIALHFVHGNEIAGEKWLITPYWTLAIDWQFYIFIGLIFFIVNRPEWWVRYPLYLFFISSKWWFYEDLKPYLFYHILLFLPGIIYFHYKRGYIKNWECYALWAFTLVFMPQKMGWNHFGAVLVSCLIMEFLNKNWSFTAFLGKISYSTYLTHIFSGWWFIVVASYMLPVEWFKTLLVLLGVVVSLLFAKLFYDKIEAPTQEWARRV